MSMYGELLGLALREWEEAHRGLEGPELEATLVGDVDERGRALAGLGPGADAPGAIAAQVSYDAALVLLCKVHGIATDLASFARPGPARDELEAALGAHGVELGPHTPVSAH